VASFKDVIAALTGRPARPAPAQGPVLPAVPTSAELVAKVDAIEADITAKAREGRVPEAVAARVVKITATARDTIPRLDRMGAGNRDAHAVMATVTSYLPEALGAYLRLPRSFADRRPVDRGKTSLMVLVDQLDLLSTTMDKIMDAAYRSDAAALVAHGRFLAEKFGTSSLDGGAGGTGAPGGTFGTAP
jgi:hypothetical protein